MSTKDHSLPTVSTRKSIELDAFRIIDRILSSSDHLESDPDDLEKLVEIRTSFSGTCSENLLSCHIIRQHCSRVRARFFEAVVRDVIMIECKVDADKVLVRALNKASKVQDALD